VDGKKTKRASTLTLKRRDSPISEGKRLLEKKNMQCQWGIGPKRTASALHIESEGKKKIASFVMKRSITGPRVKNRLNVGGQGSAPREKEQRIPPL